MQYTVCSFCFFFFPSNFSSSAIFHVKWVINGENCVSSYCTNKFNYPEQWISNYGPIRSNENISDKPSLDALKQDWTGKKRRPMNKKKVVPCPRVRRQIRQRIINFNHGHYSRLLLTLSNDTSSLQTPLVWAKLFS